MLDTRSSLALGISQVLQHLQSMMTEEWDDIRRILFVLLEAFSHNPNLLLHEKQRSIVIRALLPSLIQWLTLVKVIYEFFA